MNEITSKYNGPITHVELNKYLTQQQKIRSVIRDNNEINDSLVDDIVDGVFNLLEEPSWFNLIAKLKKISMNFQKRKKMKKVVENVLGKIFDVTGEWYVVDFQDLKEICTIHGGKDYFNDDDFNFIYKVILQKLEHGPIRDKCIEFGCIDFLNRKIIHIRDQHLIFKSIIM